jgi:hypothetical protein
MIPICFRCMTPMKCKKTGATISKKANACWRYSADIYECSECKTSVALMNEPGFDGPTPAEFSLKEKSD